MTHVHLFVSRVHEDKQKPPAGCDWQSVAHCGEDWVHVFFNPVSFSPEALLRLLLWISLPLCCYLSRSLSTPPCPAAGLFQPLQRGEAVIRLSDGLRRPAHSGRACCSKISTRCSHSVGLFARHVFLSTPSQPLLFISLQKEICFYGCIFELWAAKSVRRSRGSRPKLNWEPPETPSPHDSDEVRTRPRCL